MYKYMQLNYWYLEVSNGFDWTPRFKSTTPYVFLAHLHCDMINGRYWWETRIELKEVRWIRWPWKWFSLCLHQGQVKGLRYFSKIETSAAEESGCDITLIEGPDGQESSTFLLQAMFGWWAFWQLMAQSNPEWCFGLFKGFVDNKR